MRGPLSSVAICGIGTAGCGEAPGWSDVELLASASAKALEDAGLTFKDVDGLCTASRTSMTWPTLVAEHLGLELNFIDSTTIGGASFVGHLLTASLAIEAGLCSTVLIAYGSAQRTGMSRAVIGAHRVALDPTPHEIAHRPLNPPASYALAAARHMYEYGTKREHLAEVAVAARAWANLNPAAYKQGPLSIDDVLSSPMLVDPLTVRDCCLVTDGAAAIVLTRRDRAKDRRHKPIQILGAAATTTHRQISELADITVTGALQTGRRAFEMSGLKPSNIDVLQLYDAFTINPILFLEDLGFCKKGEGGPFVANGRIAPGGDLPVNTNGGGLSCVHPGMYSLFGIVEAVEQLRGTCGKRQIENCNTALVHGNGGVLSAQATAILSNQAAR
jgi:acetyl-CoA acetyltransferase